MVRYLHTSVEEKIAEKNSAIKKQKEKSWPVTPSAIASSWGMTNFIIKW